MIIKRIKLFSGYAEANCIGGSYINSQVCPDNNRRKKERIYGYIKTKNVCYVR